MAIITVVKTIAIKENIFVGLKFDTTLDTQKKMNLLIYKTSTRVGRHYNYKNSCICIWVVSSGCTATLRECSIVGGIV